MAMAPLPPRAISLAAGAAPCHKTGGPSWLGLVSPGYFSPLQSHAGQTAHGESGHSSRGKPQALGFGASLSVAVPQGGICHFKRGQK